MEQVTVLQVLQTIHPSSQPALQKAILLDQLLNWIPEERLEEYSNILKRLSEAHDHGDANITLQIRDGEIVSQEYSKRYKPACIK